MPSNQIHQFNCLSDNFGLLVHSPETGETASIDVPDADRVREALADKGWNLTHVFVTHHHWDHTQGIAALKSETSASVIGPAAEADKIDTLDKTVKQDDMFEWGGETVRVIETPGHTLGMVNYHLPETGAVFTGDTLFSLGCGRLFEGDAEMMWQSMQKLIALPKETLIYCGHEYTLSNARFAVTVDPDNQALHARLKQVEELRGNDRPTLPITLEEELATNPFLRPDDAAIRNTLGMAGASNAEIFAEIRKRKDNA